LALTILDWSSLAGHALSGLSPTGTLIVQTAVQTAGLITLSAVSAVIVWRRPRNRLSWVLVATMLAAALWAFAAAYAVRGLVVVPGSLPVAETAAWIQDVARVLVSLGAVVVILLFPDGNLLSRRWRLLLGAAVIVFGANLLAALDDPYPIEVGLVWGLPPVPVTMPPPLWPLGASLSWASGALTWAEVAVEVAVGAAVLLRLARARGEARLQLEWFAFGAVLYCLAVALAFTNLLAVPDWLPFADFPSSGIALAITAWSGVAAAFAGMVVVPTAIGIAMLRYRLYDIDAVINKTIIYGGLAVFVTGLYAIVVAGVGSLLGQRAGASPLLSLVAAAAVAALLLPVRSRLQDFANRLVYGKRARPYDVLSDFVTSISQAEPSDVLLPRMAELLRQGTGASRTEVWAKVGDRLQLAASSPAATVQPPSAAQTREIIARFQGGAKLEPVFHEGEVLGALVVVKTRGEELNSVEHRLFHDLASQAGLVLGRFRLVQELRESRSRIVASQDTERHRIERDLHDGAQQRFVNALLALGMAQTDDAAGEDGKSLLADASREVQAGLNELRSLARGLEPPLLTESGLVAAATAIADRAPVAAAVTAAAPERRYPPRIETAAYFVISESLTNAVKHSAATKVEVRISEAGARLCVEVEDDGVGGAETGRGTGIIGLQDRVAAVGGRLAVESPPGGGTVIKAEFPCT
jgi:signal transduction histidine kinase